MRTQSFVIPFALLLFVSAGCAGEEGAAASAGAGAGRGGRGGADGPAVPVAVGTVVQKAMPIEISVIGAAEPFSTVAIRAQTTGQLTSVNFTEGDDVRPGQVLFTLDRRPLEAALQQAQANLDRDVAQAANAAQQAKRFDELAQRGIATREQVDTSRTTVTALNATVDADKAAVENAKVQLQYATITAPISGRTGALMVHEGNLVRANDQTPLVVINQVTPISVTFAIPEARLPELRQYMAGGALRVTASPPNDDASPAVGRISFIDNAVDPDDRHDQDQGHVPEQRSPALARAVRQRRRDADDRPRGDRGAVGRRAGRPAGFVRVCREAGADGGSPPGDRRTNECDGDGDCQRAQAGRDRGD